MSLIKRRGRLAILWKIYLLGIFADHAKDLKTEGKDKQNAIATTNFVLSEFSKVIAPFAPFIAEKIFMDLGNKNSVHLENWPKVNKKLINKKLIEAMMETRKICSLGLEARQKAGIKVRQPLASLKIKNPRAEISLMQGQKQKSKIMKIF